MNPDDTVYIPDPPGDPFPMLDAAEYLLYRRPSASRDPQKLPGLPSFPEDED